MGLVFASHRDQRLRGDIILHLTHLKTYQKENSQKFFWKVEHVFSCARSMTGISLWPSLFWLGPSPYYERLTSWQALSSISPAFLTHDVSRFRFSSIQKLSKEQKTLFYHHRSRIGIDGSLHVNRDLVGLVLPPYSSTEWFNQAGGFIHISIYDRATSLPAHCLAGSSVKRNLSGSVNATSVSLPLSWQVLWTHMMKIHMAWHSNRMIL